MRWPDSESARLAARRQNASAECRVGARPAGSQPRLDRCWHPQVRRAGGRSSPPASSATANARRAHPRADHGDHARCMPADKARAAPVKGTALDQATALSELSELAGTLCCARRCARLRALCAEVAELSPAAFVLLLLSL